ncbi:hypothetical protein GS610_08105 [Ruegeria sp. HKCCD6228]|uniref:hypothetical protein n=1 Tax=Ruegeria sp. HKCCD6228 TaxID=2683001 RepID=UPI0014910048|nr:hypothetical protein [Ruegeria sp. HKCCD6228]NOD97170.1 hypothetical protein [Ruegeria sp. HKCCD6228]
MIEGAEKIHDYLPVSYDTAKERDYVRFLWEAFETNVENEKNQFAFLAYHMLVMSFVYFNIWQIKLIRQAQFETAMVGFNKNTENQLIDATSPFVFSVVNESTVLRFLKLIQCDNGKIGSYAQLVRERNDTAHANGNIFYNSESDFERRVRDTLRTVKEIQRHSEEIIKEGYRSFLIASQDDEEREYVDEAEQISEILVKQLYLSANDIGYCRDYDISELSDQPRFDQIEALHAALAEQYPPEEAE